MLDTPVIFMVFNRPEPTARVFAAIRSARPRRMTVIADGPRCDRPEDAAGVAAARAVIEEGIDWPCELTRDYSNENLGCGIRIASGLTAAFARYDHAIVLEDDTLPDPSFFRFCERMLKRYADDPRVVSVSGTNTINAMGHTPSEDGYRFSRITDIWGWASWARSWSLYDHETPDWPTVRRSGWLRDAVEDRYSRRWFSRYFDKNYAARPNRSTWDAAWVYTCMREGLTVTPDRNLVQNIGFRPGATHCSSPDHPLADLPAESIDVDRLAPASVVADHDLERLLIDHRFGCHNYRRSKSLKGRLRKLFRGRAA